MSKHTKLTKPERVLISEWIKEGLCGNEIAKRLGRNRSTIGRELKRNRTQVWTGKSDEYIYEPAHAQFVAMQRRQKAWFAKLPLKNKDIYSYVLDQLRAGWSPEAIAGSLKVIEHPNDPHWSICHETIYAFIYKEKSDLTREGLLSRSLLDSRLESHNSATTVTDCGRPLYEYLRRGQRKRRHKQGRRVHKSHIPQRVSIHQRSEVINNRSEFGHWEGDTVEGLGHRDGIHTEVERISRFIEAKKVEAINSQSAIDAQIKIFTPLPKKSRKSTTLDNGRETHLHFKLQEELNMDTYHADPYSSWQRGTNENGNGLIRKYFPKGTDFSKVTDQELQDVVWELNNRPRKILQYKTAQEVFNEQLNLS